MLCLQLQHIISRRMIQLSCLEKLVIKVLRKGHVPEHIAFIMDGNRRYAKNEKKKALSGHEDGTKTLKKCLLYCLELGVQYASFYAFSLQNFNRKEEEVQFLMKLARSQFQQLSEIYNSDNILSIVMKNNVKVQIIGDLQGKLKELFPDIRNSFAQIEEKTKNNTKMTIYICFAYDSIFEINQAIDKADKINDDQETVALSVEQREEKIFNNLLIPRNVDLLIRTSNQFRMSNFMLMQSKYAMIEIEKNFWPSFNLFIMGKILMKYNYHYNEIRTKRLSRIKME